MRFILSIIFGLCLTLVTAQDRSSSVIDIALKNASIQEVLDTIASQYGYRFSFASETFMDYKKQDIAVTDVTIDALLAQLFDEELIEYKLIDEQVLIRLKSSDISAATEVSANVIHLRGKVFQNGVNKANLISALISIKGTAVGTYTDEDGFFDLKIPKEYQEGTLFIHYLGFTEKEYQIQDLKDEFLLVPMSQGDCFLAEVTVVNSHKSVRVADTDNAMILSSSFLQNTTSGLAGSDVVRQIQLLPGISAFNDDASEIKIRGSKADETLMVLDGMPIYNASHFYGVFSSINAAYIDKISVYRNMFPVEYGGKTGGMVALESDHEIPNKASLETEINLLNANILLNTPLSSISSFSIASRSTLRNVSNSQFNTISNTDSDVVSVDEFTDKIKKSRTGTKFNFRDLNAKFLVKPSKTQQLDINYFGSTDAVSNTFKQRVDDKKDESLEYKLDESDTWSNNATSINYSNEISERISIASNLFFTQYANAAEAKIELEKKGGDNMGPPPEALGYTQENMVQDVGGDIHVNRKIAKGKATMGISAIQHNVAYLFKENNEKKLSGDDRSTEIAAYAGYNWSLLKSLNFNSALRMTHYDNTNKLYFSPRLLASMELLEGMKLKASYGRYQQFIRQLQYEYRGELKSLWVSAGSNEIPVLQSNSWMVGATLKNPRFVLDVEMYHKSMDGVIEYAVVTPTLGGNDNNLPQNYQFFTGNGIAKGIDMMLSTSYKRYDTYLAYSLSEVTESYKEIINGKHFPSEDDRRHQFKWVNSFSLGKFTFGLDALHVSGRPYTDVSMIAQNDDIRDLDPNTRFEYLKSYQRLDISASYNFNIAKCKVSLIGSVFNFSNNQNVNYIQSISSSINQSSGSGQSITNTIIGSESDLLNRTFNLCLRVGL